MLAFDSAQTLTPSIIRMAKSQGVQAFGVYIEPSERGSWKAVSKNVLSMIFAEGCYAFLIHEHDGQEYEGGANSGIQMGKCAATALSELGITAKPVVYFCIDKDAPPEKYDLVDGFIKGCQSGLGARGIAGLYAKHDIVKEIESRGTIKDTFQTLAWSHGKIYDNVDIYQKDNDNTTFINGFNLDLDDIHHARGLLKSFSETVNIGQEGVEGEMNKEDADKIINLLGNFYGALTGLGVDSSIPQSEIHRLANELRKASGQPIQP